MIVQLETLPVVESCPSQVVVVNRESEFPDQMQFRFGERTESRNVPGVLGDLRFH